MSHHPGKFTWFEHVSTDKGRARTFYEGLFGWKVQAVPMGGGTYEMLHNGTQGIGGLEDARGRAVQWLGYLSVEDVDASHAAAVAAGAKSLMAPTDFAGAGRAALLQDPTGATVSLWRGTDPDRDDVTPTPAGDWCWNELMTPDPARALAFYESVFGYSHDDMDMGPGGTYHLLKDAQGTPRAGVMKSPEPGVPAFWMPYVEVEDADATAARVAPLGGSLHLAPQDIPGVGRIGVLIDPLGAPLGFIKSEVRA